MITGKKMNVKIAIATKDGNRLSAYFGGSRVFKIFEIRKSKLIDKHFRQNGKRFNDPMKIELINRTDQSFRKEFYNALSDCDVIFTHRMSKNTWNVLGLMGKEIIFTEINDADKNVDIYLNKNAFDLNKMHH